MQMMPERHGHLRLLEPAAAATPEQAAAIVAAIERFIRATAPAIAATPAIGADGWRRAAILEGVLRETGADPPDPWINT
jgi:hypothetical protein